MNIIMLGAPGAGKGTLASKMKVKYNIPHIATGDIFRENIKNNTELGKLVKSYTEKGELVPDEVTIKIVVDRLNNDDCKDGFILDGFPRTIAQAEGLKEKLKEKNSKIDYCILVSAEDDDIVKRLLGRRVCSSCGEPYHIVHMKPKKDGICDKCGGEVIQRKDDTEEVIKDRLNVYHKSTAPLIDYYEKEGCLKSILGFDTIENNLEIIDKFLKA